MVNVLKFIYDELLLIDGLSNYVGTRISYGKSEEDEIISPLLIYKEVTNAKIDFKGTRNEFIQISIWGKKGLENTEIKALLVGHFHMLKKSPIKNVSVKTINDTFDKELNMFGKHLTLHVKLQDTF